jgi:hypothetical protein
MAASSHLIGGVIVSSAGNPDLGLRERTMMASVNVLPPGCIVFGTCRVPKVMRCGCHVGNSGTWLRGTMGSWRGTRADVRAQGGGAISPVVASMAGMVSFFSSICTLEMG